MSERRAIKSNIWDDEFFGMDLSILEKLVWIGLFSKCADNQGRLLDNAALIRSQLFPYGEVTIEEIESCLKTYNGKIIRYSAHDRNYIQLKKWWDHQPLQWAVPSNYPPPDGWKDKVRTNYKGHKIVYNWDGQEDTLDGTNLIGILESLGRFSSWIDYVGRLNPNPNPNPKQREEEDAAPPNDHVTYLTIWTKVTGMIAYPNKERENIPYTIQAIYTQHKEKTVEYLKLFYEDWRSRGYSKTNPGWLDWALADQIPDNKPKEPKKQKEYDYTLDENDQLIVVEKQS